MITILKETTLNPISVIGERAGVCWGADISNPEKNYQRGLNCIKSNHGRTLEYVNVEMVIDGYSARVIREWYTHIGGSPSRLQESTRYVDYSDGYSYVIPNSVMKNKEALSVYKSINTEVNECIKKLIETGIPREDAAMLLPIGMTTKIVDKRNLRNLVDMSHQRLCARAYWEYRKLMHEIMEKLSEYSDEWKWIVDNLMKPKCEVFGFCTEAKSCGRKPKAE